MQLKPIEEQVVVVFGASSGIGRATALRCARQGARVVAAARSEQGLASLVEEIEAAGGQAVAVQADVADFDQVRAVAERAVEVFGRLDTWAHIAAVAIYATVEQTTPEEYRRVVEVNLLGQIYGAKAALPYLRQEGRGALVHVSSIEARRAFPYHSAYASTKHGIQGFLDALRLELRHEKVPISVTEILPASINTPLFNKARTKLGVKPMALPPFYQPELVAEAIVFAAQHPRRQIIVGGAGKSLTLLQRISPQLADEMLLRTGFKGQRTDEPKPEDAPDSLYEPLAGQSRVEGDFGELSTSRSPYTWLQLHPAARRTLTGLATLAGVAYSVRKLREH